MTDPQPHRSVRAARHARDPAEHVAAAMLSLATIAFFAGGWFAGALGASRARGFVFVLVAALAVFAVGHALSGTNVALSGFPMGLMNALLGRAGAPPAGLAFAAGTAKRLAQHLALAARRAARSDHRGARIMDGARMLTIPSAILSALIAFDRNPARPA
ncbi:MAG: DUF1275 family protein [Rhizomicrobium sp.]